MRWNQKDEMKLENKRARDAKSNLKSRIQRSDTEDENMRYNHNEKWLWNWNKNSDEIERGSMENEKVVT